MNIQCVDPCSSALWIDFANSCESSVFHSPQWMRVLAETYGLETCSYVLLDEDGNPTAGLPFCRIYDSKGKRRVTLPFSDFCDPLVEKPEQWNNLLARLLEEGASFFLRCLHNQLPLADPRLQCVNRAKWHGLDLQADLDALWSALHSSARRAIRKSERSGIEVRVAQERQELRAFYQMHLRVRKYKYRLLAQPYQFFESIWEQFVESQEGLLLLARYRDEIIAGTMFLQWKDTLFYKFNASSLDNLAFRPNDLLLWKGIEQAKSRGCSFLDFGLSDWDQDGLIQYKRKYATDEKTIFFLRSLPEKVPSIAEQQLCSLLPQLTDLLTDPSVPDSITEKAGEALYRFFT